jgi:pantoate--beta-alanine ligase
VDVLFAPTVAGVYPPGYTTYVNVEKITERWEGASRPGHFRGVATVCAKLFTICRPHRAYFGQKDYQQSLVVRRLVGDLNLGLEVVVLPTVREPDGLALSSRNVLLRPEERRQATVLSRALFQAQASARAGERDAARLRAAIEAQIGSPRWPSWTTSGSATSTRWSRWRRITGKAVAMVAAKFGATRLIDNVLRACEQAVEPQSA